MMMMMIQCIIVVANISAIVTCSVMTENRIIRWRKVQERKWRESKCRHVRRRWGRGK